MKPYASYKPSGVAWLGDVPAHWISAKLKFRLERNDGGAWGADPEGANDTLVLRSTEQTVDGRWKLEDPAYRKLSPTEAEATLLVEGDLLVTKSSGSETHIGKTSLVDAEIATLRAGYSNFMQRLRVVHEVIPKYVWYLLNSGTTKTQVNILASTTTGLANLNAGVLGQLILAYPPPDEQQAIADYLDTETARIDTLVQEKEELIGLLKEARSATITEAVSRGLCPSVPLKSSGLHFLGNVPKHWKKFKVAHAFGTSSGTTPPTDEPKWYEGDVPWVQSSELRENVVFSTEKKVTVEAVQKFSALKIYPAGTLLLAMYGATIGRVGLLGVPATTNQACCALHPLGEISTQFFCWWLQAYRDELVARGYGGGQPNISATLISGMYFFAPLPEEQQAIAEYLDDETAKIDALITHTQEEIALLKELRAATIADAVLGRVDVRTTVTKGVRRAENEL